MKQPPEESSGLPPGLYEKLLAEAERKELQRAADPRLYTLGSIDAEDAHTAIAQYLERLFATSLAQFRGKDGAERQRRLVQRVTTLLAEELSLDGAERICLADPLQRLLAVHREPVDSSSKRPDTSLSRSTLLTSTRLDPSLASQLRKEIATADRVDILCSFVRWSGLRMILDELRLARLITSRTKAANRLASSGACVPPCPPGFCV